MSTPADQYYEPREVPMICECGHAVDDHEVMIQAFTGKTLYVCGVHGCECQAFTESRPEPEYDNDEEM